MKIFFTGASKETTGSKHLIEIDGIKILLDCGMFQGPKEEALKKNKNFLFNPKDINFVILSHAHIDHSGLLPLLVKKGYKGKIYCTKATKDIVSILLLDSAHIQENEAIKFNKKHHNHPHIYPLYDQVDVYNTIKLLKGVEYDTWIDLTENIRYKHIEAGHILGSSQILIEYKEKGSNIYKRLLFSGDLGRWDMPLLNNPIIPDWTDILILESTYGSRLHDPYENTLPKLAEVVNKVYDRKGKILIPAFALERAQEILYNLAILYNEKKIPKIPVYVDSPITVSITNVFEKYTNLYDEEAINFLKQNNNSFHFKNVNYVSSVEESKLISFMDGPCIIISAQGMCEAGRILHHIKNNIEDSKNLLLIVGFQAPGTLGRKLEDGISTIKIFGEIKKVNAEVLAMHNFSAHADYNDLIKYATSIKNIKKIFLVHGDIDNILALKSKLNNYLKNIDIIIPDLNNKFEG